LTATLSPKNLQECLNDALYYRDEIRPLFSHGSVTLRERGLAEHGSTTSSARSPPSWATS
jgi:arginine decarboxylase